MNCWAKLNALKVNFESRLTLGLEYKLKNYPVGLGIEGWSGSDSGIRTQIQFESNHRIKQ
jgi:hypothetical protein